MTVVVAVSAASGQGQSDDTASRDVRHTIQARKMLAEIPELADLTIGVTVTNRVAVLWGAVPSASAAFRAELCLRTMIELADVRSELFVTEPLDPILRPLKINKLPPWVPDRLPAFTPTEPRTLFAAPGVIGQDTIDTKRPKTKPAEIKTAPPEMAPTPMLGVPEIDLVPKRLRD